MGNKILPTSFRLEHNQQWESSWVGSKKKYSNFFVFDYNIRNYLKNLCNRSSIHWVKIVIQKKINLVNLYVFIHNQDRKPNKFFKRLSYKKKKVKLKKYLFDNKLKKSLRFFRIKKRFILSKKLQLLKKPDYKPYDLTKLIFQKKVIEKNLNKFSKSLKLDISVYLSFINTDMKCLNKKKEFWTINNFLKNKQTPYKFQHFSGILNTSIYTKSVKLFNYFLIKNLNRTSRHLQFFKQFNEYFQILFNKYPNFIGYKIQLKGRINGLGRAKTVIIQSGLISLNTLRNDVKYDCHKIITKSGVCSLKTWFLFKN